jgi:hypothetical protein
MSQPSFTRPLLICDIFDALPDDIKERVADLFVDWLQDSVGKINTRNFAEFLALVSYHAEDIAKSIHWMLKPGFRPIGSVFMALVMPIKQFVEVDELNPELVNVGQCDGGEQDVVSIREILVKIADDSKKPVFESAVSKFASMKPEDRVSKTVQFANYVLKMYKQSIATYGSRDGPRIAAEQLLSLLSQRPEPWIYMLFVFRPEKRLKVLQLFYTFLRKWNELAQQQKSLA